MVEYQSERKILDLRFEELVRANPNDFYCVLVQVYYNDNPLPSDQPVSEINIKSRFKYNKDILERFVKENDIYVHDNLEYLPRMILKMTGVKLMELSQKDYIEYIANGDETVAYAV